MKLRIVSDGTGSGTVVMDEDGNTVDRVVSINWSVGGRHERAQAVITIDAVGVDVIAEGPYND